VEIKNTPTIVGVFLENYARFFAVFFAAFFTTFFAFFFAAMIIFFVFSLSGCDHSDNFFPVGKNLL
jgi:hypothetical protein